MEDTKFSFSLNKIIKFMRRIDHITFNSPEDKITKGT